MEREGNGWKPNRVKMDLTGEEDGAVSLLLGSCPIPIFDHKQIVLGHGSNPTLDKLNDQTVVTIGGPRLAFTTDSFVVTPIFFRGGDIGRLAIHGTVNDLVMCGARPLYLSAAFILEEGLSVDDLCRVVESMRSAAAEAGVQLVTGDTKVVNRGKGDQIFITTTGIGVIEHDISISADRVRPGDQDHPQRLHRRSWHDDHELARGSGIRDSIESDCAPLNGLVTAILATASSANDFIHTLRDPTRGGVATTLNEIAKHANVGIVLDDRAIPVRESVKGACEVLGLDPLYVANEGKLLAAVVPEMADAVLEQMRRHRLGQDAAIIGEVVEHD